MISVSRLVGIGGFAVAAASFAYIDLEGAFTLGRFRVNAPVVDWIGLAFFGSWACRCLLRRDSLGLAPAPVAFGLFLAIAAVSALGMVHALDGLHVWLRKFTFYYLAFGVALSGWLARQAGQRTWSRCVLFGLVSLAVVSLLTSAARWSSGASLWHVAIAGFTPNHKTLAVALAPWFPLVIALWRGAKGRERLFWGGAALLLALAVGASASKTAWICLAFGAALVLPNATDGWGWRPKVALPLLIGGVALSLNAPLLLGSKALLDAARSRHSLNLRAVQMVRAHPAFGAGPGSNVDVEMVEFPHYRVNGVDAHGVVQKVASETGLAGLAAFGGFLGLVLLTAARRRRLSPVHAGAAGTLVALHVNLLLSTETFSPTHWFPLAVAWGLLHAPPPEKNP